MRNPAPSPTDPTTRPSAARAWFRIIAVALLSGQATYLYLKWQQQNETRSFTSPSSSPNYEEPNRAAAFVTDDDTSQPPEKRYQLRAQALLAAAIAEEGIAYLDVINVAYSAGRIDAALLARKADWRRRLTDQFTFFADYALMRVITPVRRVNAVQDTTTGETMHGIYAQPENVILISGRSPTILFHEAGHVLQRRFVSPAPGLVNLVATNTLDGTPAIYAAFAAGRISDSEERRITYLTSQKEFEMLLQDLNRLHAVYLGGNPIMTPKDAVRALHLAGLLQTQEQVAQCVAGTEWSRVSDEVDQLQYLPPATDARQLFPDAARVIGLQTLALRADPLLWQSIYRKILFEAPGHL